MKTMILTSALALSATTLFAAPHCANDTIVRAVRPDSVIITEVDSTTSVQIFGSEKDKSYRFKYTKRFSPDAAYTIEEHASRWDFSLPFQRPKKTKSQRDFTMGGVNFGFVTALGAPKDMEVDMASSYEISFDAASIRLYSKNRRHFVSVGLGFAWRNFRLTGHSRFVQDDFGNLLIKSDAEENTRTEYSRIKLFSLSIPFRYGHDFNKHWTAYLATILNFNTYASAETRYKRIAPETGVSHNVIESTTDIHQKPVSVDFLAQLQWRWVGLYVKYSPCKVLKTNYGPSFTPLSVGFSFLY